MIEKRLIPSQLLGVYEQNFDAWGRERNPNDWSYSSNTNTKPAWLIRGFTGHEHLDEFALINMNGRVYDPLLGRMLSPDNFVQTPHGTQGYNRYSYALNNPLRYIDPDGNNPIILAAAIGFMIYGHYSGVKAIEQGKSYNYGFVRGAPVGALAGAGGAWVGAMAGASIGIGGFWGGMTSGALGGGTSGFITGFGGTLAFGGTLDEALVAGGKSALMGGLTGGVMCGLMGGLDAASQGRDFWNGGYKTYKLPDGGPLQASNDEIVFNEEGFTVQNKSGETIFYKPEDTDPVSGIKKDGAYPIKNGRGIMNPIDGVTAPGKHGEVFKVITPFNDSQINVTYSNITIDKGYMIGENTLNIMGGGGWLTSPPNAEWNSIFRSAGYIFR